jgi:hypothetical protein
MRLEEVLASLPVARQEKVGTTLSELRARASGIIVRLLDNLQQEQRLPEDIWVSVIEGLETIPAATSDPDWPTTVIDMLRGCFSRALKPALHPAPVPSMTPVGPVIDDLSTATFGRIVSLVYLESWWSIFGALATSPGTGVVFPKGASARALIRVLTRSDGKRVLPAAILDNLPLGKYIMWSTFDEVHRGADPFDPQPGKFLELVAVLGLDPVLLGLSDEDGNPIPGGTRPNCVLLSYNLPTGVSPHIPTIVEAYAGSGRMNYYFRVTDYEVSYPRPPQTLPSPRGMHLRGRPEVVHSVISALNISAPLEVRPYE